MSRVGKGGGAADRRERERWPPEDSDSDARSSGDEEDDGAHGSGEAGGGAAARAARRDKTRDAILALEARRLERRRSAAQFRRGVQAEQKRNARQGNTGDVLFQRLIRAFRSDNLTSARGVRQRDPRACLPAGLETHAPRCRSMPPRCRHGWSSPFARDP